jgi:ferredoxin-NADP reductase
MSWLRRRAGPLIVLGTSALGGAAYRYAKPADSAAASLNPHDFTPYTLVDKQPVSSTSAIFTLRSRNYGADIDTVKEVSKRSVWSVQIKQPQLQIARAYTPLPPSRDGTNEDEEEPDDIRLLIRQEQGGEVSTYLHRLPEQSTVELRGPNTEFKLPREITEVIFLAGGTGIAPAMQVAQALGRRTGSRMHILWANRRREECVGGISDDRGDTSAQNRVGWWKSFFGSSEPVAQASLTEGPGALTKGVIVQELDALKKRSEAATKGLSVNYYVDDERSFVQPNDIGKRTRRQREENGSRLIIVSGPGGFIEHWAGKKVWAGGREVQGPLGGQLGKMDLGEWKVIKL